VLLGLLLGLAWGIPIGAVVAVLVKLPACEVASHHELGEGSLDCFGADPNALLRFQLLSDLACFEACVGHSVAKLSALASADDAEPSLDDTEAQGCDRAKPLPIGGRHLR
jgi:hypothetical protein